MSHTVQDILEIIEKIAPENLAESWDNVGLMIGDPTDRVRSILLGLDPTLPLLEEAASKGANLIITHHPIIFHPLKSIRFQQPEGSFIHQAILKNINVISSHTNFDSAVCGVNDTLAQLVGLTETEPLAAANDQEGLTGLGRIGNFPVPVSSAEFVERIKKACHPPWMLEAGPRPEKIARAAVCGGSCSNMAETALRLGAQVFVTAEVKHNIARWAEQTGMWIIDAGHFPTENPAMVFFAKQLKENTIIKREKIDIMVTESQESPLRLI